MNGVPHPFPMLNAVKDAGKQYSQLMVDSLCKEFEVE
jgi:hypothetical protein